jgi:hypothetical protein
VISPYALLYAETMINRYYYAYRRVDRLCGVSLFNAHYSEVNEEKTPRDLSTIPEAAYLYQYPQSWGALFSPICWRNFTDFATALISAGTDPLVPNSFANRWPHAKSWMKYLFRYMYETGSFMVYPVLNDKLSFSQNKLEIGSNDQLKPGTKAYRRKMSKVGVELLTDESQFQEFMGVAGYPLPHDADPLSKLQVYNIYNQRSESYRKLIPHSSVQASVFDHCTIVSYISSHQFNRILEYF